MFKKLMGMKGNAACTLNRLVKANQDGEKAYRAGAEIAKDSEVKSTFLRHADLRNRFAADLAAEVRKLGEEPAAGGTWLGAVLIPMRMQWAKMMGDTDARLVSAAESGEDCAKNAYAKALKEELPIDARKIVETQMEGIQESHDRMRALEKGLEPAEDESTAGRPV